MLRIRLFLILTVALLFCSAQIFAQGIISGHVSTPWGEPVSGVMVSANGPNVTQTFTDDNGNYSLELPYGGNYTISAWNNTLPANGVTSFDIVLARNHLDQTQLLQSPYLIIAADANRSSQIDPIDFIEVTNMILGIQIGFANNTSWRFVPASYVFPDPTNPFLEIFPESEQIQGFNSDVVDLDFVALKTGDLNGTAITQLEPDANAYAILSGRVYHDVNSDCTADPTELGPMFWTVQAQNANGQIYTGSTDTLGRYQIQVPPGSYDLTVTMPTGSPWQPSCTTVQSVSNVVAPSSLTGFDFAIAPGGTPCPLMEVEASTFFLRRCFENTYYINYINNGTAIAEDATAVIRLDPMFDFLSSSIPPIAVDGQEYTFALSDLPPLSHGRLNINFTLNCESEAGQTHCLEAYVYPVVECTPPSPEWSGADLQVDAACLGDEVRFTIRNNGDAMTEPVEYIVIEDIMIQMRDNTLQLGAGETTQVDVPANGATWRMEVSQVQHHPDNTYQCAFVEGCGTAPFSQGIINQFALGDEKPNFDRDCRLNQGAFDPNDKTGFPLGVDDEHFIKPGQELDYLVRFQNTGTDTAFTVVIRDTLDQDFVAASIKPGPSSHRYYFNLLDNRVLEFTFPQIMLPDSNVNEPASHGFVRFSIEQQPDLPLGTVLENSAAIYFDFNDPVITNTTLHTLGQDFLAVRLLETPASLLSMRVFPNPSTHTAVFELDDAAWPNATLRVWDAQGRQVHEQLFTAQRLSWPVQHLSAGHYFFEVRNQQTGDAANGVLVIK